MPREPTSKLKAGCVSLSLTLRERSHLTLLTLTRSLSVPLLRTSPQKIQAPTVDTEQSDGSSPGMDSMDSIEPQKEREDSMVGDGSDSQLLAESDLCGEGRICWLLQVD